MTTQTADCVYEVPPPAKPVDDDLPHNYLYTVRADYSICITWVLKGDNETVFSSAKGRYWLFFYVIKRDNETVFFCKQGR